MDRFRRPVSLSLAIVRRPVRFGERAGSAHGERDGADDRNVTVLGERLPLRVAPDGATRRCQGSSYSYVFPA
jgi:hypothetical protein